MEKSDRPNHSMALLVEHAREIAARATRREAATLLEEQSCPLPVIARVLSPDALRASSSGPNTAENRYSRHSKQNTTGDHAARPKSSK